MIDRFIFSKKRSILTSVLLFIAILLPAIPIKAVDYESLAEERKSMPIESNSYENWPLGPSIGAKSAILIDANTGAVLYEKNIHEKLYPASITKLLTAYIAIQHCEPDEMITFSTEAIESINWWEDANMGVNAGASLPLEDVLYGLLVGSANEAAYALAEHISGDVEKFAKLMNQTAKELGCTNSNFVTPNGIHDDNHYTTAHDMAIISRAFFSNDTLAKMSGTPRFEVPVTKTQTRKDIILTAKSQLLPGKTYAYDSLVGTKTGYTENARQTLVSCASKEGMKLICIILLEETPAQYTDTIALFNYGFDNFDALNISEIDTKYTIDNFFFTTDSDFFGSSKPILELDNNDYIILPNTISFEDTRSEITYNVASSDEVASIQYYYKDTFLGEISLKLAVTKSYMFDFSTQQIQNENPEVLPPPKTIFINITHLIALILIIAIILSVVLLIRAQSKHKKGLRYVKSKRRRIFSQDRHWRIDRY